MKGDAKVLELLNDLRQTLGMAMILISHDFATVRVACDRVAVMYAGQLCEYGPLEQVLDMPFHRYTSALLDNWGVTRLAHFERSESIDEMKHADRLAERILFLDGLPNFQALGRLHVGENVEEVLKGDLELELEALTQLRGAIAHCEKVKDYGSRDLFSEILQNEENHVDTLEQQFEMIARMGLQNYIQLQSEAAEAD